MKYAPSYRFLFLTLLLYALCSCSLSVNVQAQNKPKQTRAEKQAFKKANEVYESLQRGANFDSLARHSSNDLGSAKSGGNLGWARKGQMVPEFEAKVLTMQPGEISKPVRSDFGYHIIQLLQWKGDKYESRHILIRVE
jgi:peptidyl-prolyl cis-trans isomerase SurA